MSTLLRTPKRCADCGAPMPARTDVVFQTDAAGRNVPVHADPEICRQVRDARERVERPLALYAAPTGIGAIEAADAADRARVPPVSLPPTPPNPAPPAAAAAAAAPTAAPAAAAPPPPPAAAPGAAAAGAGAAAPAAAPPRAAAPVQGREPPRESSPEAARYQGLPPEQGERQSGPSGPLPAAAVVAAGDGVSGAYTLLTAEEEVEVTLRVKPTGRTDLAVSRSVSPLALAVPMSNGTRAQGERFASLVLMEDGTAEVRRRVVLRATRRVPDDRSAEEQEALSAWLTEAAYREVGL